MSLAHRSATVFIGCAACILCGSLIDSSRAQEVRVMTQDGAVKVAPPAQAVPGAPVQGAPPKEGEKPPASGTPDKTEQKGGDKPAEKPGEPARPRRKPAQPANPDELKARPGDDGRISFSFKGQDWEDVLEWLADIAGMSLQMEEVPPGFLNLTSRGRYTVAQVMDLFNSALINKGYTLLRNGDILLVSKLEKLDKSLVPRVEPNELDSRGTYEFVKCFFDLNSLIADSTAEEIKPMLSPHGKITALKTTNRLDIVETAGNLRRIRDFLAEEQSDRGKENVLREFKLKHVRAAEVYETLHTILGLKKVGPQVALTPDQIAQMQQAFMQAAQQAAQQAGKGGGGQPPGKEVYLAINNHENSILANAPPDKMTIIEQAVKAMDIPKNKSDSLLANLPRLRSYKLSAVDPAVIVKVLQDLGNLDPQTRLEVDARSKSILAFATVIDHVTIQAIVDKIDGTGRHFEVIQLHVLEADMVAGSIEFLMRGPEEKPRSNYSPFFFFDGFGGSRSRQADRDPADQLQVEADTERNRLLIRATDSELKEIRELLVKLGELPDDDRSRQTMRVVPMSPGDMQKLIERIQNMWPGVAPNPLRVAPIQSPGNGAEDENSESPPRRRTESRTERPLQDDPGADRRRASTAAMDANPSESAVHDIDSHRVARLLSVAAMQLGKTRPETELESEERKAESTKGTRRDELVPPFQRRPAQEEAEPPAPIAITPGPNGLVLSSEDTEALDQLERIIAELAPVHRLTSKLFYLRNSFCKDVAYVLEDVFKEEDGTRRPSPYFDDMYYYYRYGPGSRDSAKERGRLSKRKRLKFIPETATNTILVQGADPVQLAEIERLIKIYDEGVRPDSNAVRVTRRFAFQYTTAKEVAEVIKDVFRDLLSPTDKALAKGGPQQQQQEQNRSLYSYTYIFGDSTKDDAIKFKGPISMGVDERSNTLIVSARKDLMNIIMQLADELDQSARESRGVVQVMKLGNGLDPAQVEKLLSGVGKSPSTPVNGQPQEPSGEKPQAQQTGPQVNRTYVYPGN